MLVAVVIIVVGGLLAGLFMVLRQDWESVEVDAQLTRWGRLRLRLLRQLGPGADPPAGGPVEPKAGPSPEVPQLGAWRKRRQPARDPSRRRRRPA